SQERRHGRLAQSTEGSDRGRYLHTRNGRILQTAAKLAGRTEQRPPDRMGLDQKAKIRGRRAEVSDHVYAMRVLVITGAGLSAESGVPTFLGKDGYWRTLDPA